MQTLATLLGPTCCKRLHTMLCVVACCCVLLRLVGSCWTKFETGQTSEPTSANISIVSRSSKRGPTMLRSFAQHIQQCCAGVGALQTTIIVVCMELSVFVSQSPLYSHVKTQHVVTCCERLHTSRNKRQKCWPNNVACCCERLHGPLNPVFLERLVGSIFQ